MRFPPSDSVFRTKHTCRVGGNWDAERFYIMENILGGKFESSKTNGEEQVSNPFAAFAHGMIHSVENSYNGVAQVVSGNKADQLKISKQADSNSALAKGAHTAGELVGSGVQLVTIGRMLPEAKSIFGGVVRSGAVGAIYGGLLQPTEGINIGEERFKNALTTATLTSTFEIGRLAAIGAGFSKPTLLQTLGRGSFAGGLGGASHEVMNSTLNRTELTINNVGRAVASGMVLGAGMELTSMAYNRTSIRNLLTETEGSMAKGTAKPTEIERDPELLARIRAAAKGDGPSIKDNMKDGEAQHRMPEPNAGAALYRWVPPQNSAPLKPTADVPELLTPTGDTSHMRFADTLAPGVSPGAKGKPQPEFVQIFKWEPAYNSPEARAAAEGPGY